MTRSMIAIFITVSLCSCSSMLKKRVDHGLVLSTGRSLWQLTIGDKESPVFSGILALHDSGNSLDVVLLDSTGIRLLAERVEAGGEIDVHSAVKPVEEKGLPDYLGSGLYRIFQFEKGNGDDLCPPALLLQTCFGEDAQGRLFKSGYLGPFKLWSVEYFINKKKDRPYLSGVVLNQGWFKPDIQLERMKQE